MATKDLKLARRVHYLHERLVSDLELLSELEGRSVSEIIRAYLPEPIQRAIKQHTLVDNSAIDHFQRTKKPTA